jgi:hypothetical protein
MGDHSTFDAFEQRIAGELERYVANAVDPKPAAEIAAAAMQPRGVDHRARNAPRSRRLLMLGIAAVLLVPAVYLGAGGVRPTPAIPVPSAVPRAIAPTPSTAPGPEGPQVAIFVRRVIEPVAGLSIFAVGADGAEKLVRHIPDSVGGQGAWVQGGWVSSSGWLALLGDLSTSMYLVDLRDDQATPRVVEDTNIGGVGPRWGPTGLVAAYADRSDGNGVGVIVVDPETGAIRSVKLPNGLVGGGPWIVWSGDGGGIVDGGPVPRVIPIDGGPPARSRRCSI